MEIDLIGIVALALSLMVGSVLLIRFFKEKSRLIASEEFLALYKKVYDSFGQRAGIPSVEQLRYKRVFPQSAFFIRRNLNMELSNEQKSMLHSYSLQVRKSHIFLGLAVWFGVLALVSIIWLAT